MELYGSSASGFGTVSSDMDISVSFDVSSIVTSEAALRLYRTTLHKDERRDFEVRILFSKLVSTLR